MPIVLEAKDGSHDSQKYPYIVPLIDDESIEISSISDNPRVVIESLPTNSINTSLFDITTEAGPLRRLVIHLDSITINEKKQTVTFVGTRRKDPQRPMLGNLSATIHYTQLRRQNGIELIASLPSSDPAVSARRLCLLRITP